MLYSSRVYFLQRRAHLLCPFTNMNAVPVARPLKKWFPFQKPTKKWNVRTATVRKRKNVFPCLHPNYQALPQRPLPAGAFHAPAAASPEGKFYDCGTV